jgi:hypothetical protein
MFAAIQATWSFLIALDMVSIVSSIALSMKGHQAAEQLVITTHFNPPSFTIAAAKPRFFM